MKKIIAGVIIVAIIAAGGFYFLNKKKSKPEAKSATRIEKVERGFLLETISSTGRVVSNKDVEIKCKASGEIISLPFDVSDNVNKGDLVVELDPEDEMRSVKNSEASLSQAQARLEKTKETYQVAVKELANAKRQAEVAYNASKNRAADAAAKEERVKVLLDKKLAGREEYDTAHNNTVQAQADLEKAAIALDDLKVQESALSLKRRDIGIAESDLKSSRIQLDLVRKKLKDTRVYAPMDGVVTVRAVQEGQIISSGISNVGGGTSVMTISDLSRIFILAAVDESDIGNIKPDQRVHITVDAYPEERFRGRVERVAQKGVVASNVVTFEVKIEVMGPNKEMLKPEMTANVDIAVAAKRDVLQIPSEAVVRTPRGSMVKIATADDIAGKQKEIKKDKDGNEIAPDPREAMKNMRRIETGIDNGEMVEVISGLKEGEKIVVTSGASGSSWQNDGQGREDGSRDGRDGRSGRRGGMGGRRGGMMGMPH